MKQDLNYSPTKVVGYSCNVCVTIAAVGISCRHSAIVSPGFHNWVRSMFTFLPWLCVQLAPIGMKFLVEYKLSFSIHDDRSNRVFSESGSGGYNQYH